MARSLCVGLVYIDPLLTCHLQPVPSILTLKVYRFHAPKVNIVTIQHGVVSHQRLQQLLGRKGHAINALPRGQANWVTILTWSFSDFVRRFCEQILCKNRGYLMN